MRIPRTKLWTLVGGIFLAQGAIQMFGALPLWNQNYKPKGQVSSNLSPDQMILAFAGMREMIANILWVRADTFFDQGMYDAVLPIIRLTTWLDPRAIDIYATGMWHIGYNFTDEQSRSDRRYIPSALALGAEGSRNNPETYEMFFETGWIWHHKIADGFPKAVYWMEEARKRPDLPPARGNILSMAYQRNGELDKALDLMYKQYDAAAKRVLEGGEYGDRNQRDTVGNNINVMLGRMSQRGAFAKPGEKPPVPFDTDPKFDVGFTAQVTIPEPAQLRIRATWNVRPVGTRVRVILRDADYPNAIPGGMVWDATNEVALDPPKNLTYMQDDNLFFRNRRADKTIDMSRDPTMYPLVSDKYYLEFYYNPRIAPPHIQDKFSWSGEGMTAKPEFLNTEIREGQRVVFYRMELTRDMLRRTGDWLDKVPVFATPYFEEDRVRNTDDNLIQVPGILAEP